MLTLFLDVETTGLDPLSSELVTIQLMTTSGKAIIIKDPQSLETLKPKIENSLIVGHNLKFDAKFLKYHFGITLYNIYDTYLAEIAISGGILAGRRGASLKDLVRKYCGITLDKTEQLGFKKGEPLTIAQEQYAVNDLKYLPEIKKKQQIQIVEKNLENIIDIEMKCLPAVVWLELSGIHVDLNRLEEVKALVFKKYHESEAYLQEALATYGNQAQLDGSFIRNKLNLNSPEQLKKALKDKGYNIESIGKTARAAFANDPIFQALANYKEADQLVKNFINKLPGFINSSTHRVYGNFKQYGAASGRFTCGKPNLQQQPSRFKEWRTIFTAEPGNKIVACDFSQIELRIVGQLAQDEKYIDAYKNKQDLHKRTAAAMFKVSLGEVNKDQRNVAKSVNFGLNYGMGKRTLKSKLKLDTGFDFTEEESGKFIKEFRKLYPQVFSFQEKASKAGLQTLEARTEAGRYFKFDQLVTDSEEKYNEWKGRVMRNSKSWPIQGLCADMLKIAMGNLFPILEPRGVKLVNCVHDELVFECKAEEAEEVGEIAKAEMERAGNLFLKDLPCKVEVTIADYWMKG